MGIRSTPDSAKPSDMVSAPAPSTRFFTRWRRGATSKANGQETPEGKGEFTA